MECTGQVNLGKHVKVFAEPRRQGQDIANLLCIERDVPTMPAWKGGCNGFVNTLQENNTVTTWVCFRCKVLQTTGWEEKEM